MEPRVECTHCRVVMTSWSAPGSTIRYYQCPFCQRTHSSLYGEVFRRRAGARVVETAPSAGGIPMASPEDVRWARVKATAARWFARLDEDERSRSEPGADAPGSPLDGLAADGGSCAEAAAEAPDANPADVVEVEPAVARGG